jgi:hypothetical protein
MARSFSHDMSVPGSPSDVQARLRGVLIERLRRSAKMRLAGEEPNSMTFRPRWSWPLLLALYHQVSGETVHVKFSAAEGGTQVAVSGKVAGNAEAVADQEFWAEALRAA